MKLAELADRINAHLKRFEADPNINRRDTYGARFYNAGAWSHGAWLRVVYISYQGATPMRKAEAERYLAWLDAGNVGRHFEAFRASDSADDAL